MALECLVKISSVTNLSDARYTAGMGVDLMGFDLDPSSDYFVDHENFNAITSWISGVKIVGELGSIDADKAKQLLEYYQVDYVQINAGMDPTSLEGLSLPVIIRISQPDKAQIAWAFEQYQDLPIWYLLEPDTELSGELLQWCAGKTGHYPLMLGSNLSAENIHERLQAGFGGISLRGGQELRPGYRNFDELADILEALEID